MTLGAVKNLFYSTLAKDYNPDELQTLFAQLGTALFNKDRASLHLMGDYILANNERLFFNDAIRRLKAQEPIQYIIGSTEFYGIPIKVTPAVLIPRPETEELIAWILQEMPNTTTNILDLCTGSGCIAIALATYFNKASVAAVDVSKDAIALAKTNAKNNKVNIDFQEADVLKLDSFSSYYDLIVSNPPYVRESEKQFMQPNVLDFEPELALFVTDRDPLVFYKAIGEFALAQLKPTGCLFLEINEYLSKELMQLMQDLGFKTVVLKHDLNQVPRMLKCSL